MLKYLFDNFCLLLAKRPLFGFSVSIKQNPSPIGIGFKGNPGISTFNTPISRDPSVHWRVSWGERLHSSKLRQFPSSNACVYIHFTGITPAKESLFPINFPKISPGLVLALILNLNNFLWLTWQAISIYFVFPVPGGPTKRQFAPLEI